MRLNGVLVGGFLIAAMAMSPSAYSAAITNADVIKLLEAKIPEEVILQAIASGERNFDTSANALITLRSKGATSAILKAILAPAIEPANRVAASTVSPPQASGRSSSEASGELNPEVVMLLTDGQETELHYLVPNIRSAVRALGFGGFATYAGLDGPRSRLRFGSSPLDFLVSVPKNAQPGSYVTLASFAVRPNGTREVSIMSGGFSVGYKIPPERVVSTAIERMADQGRAKDGFALYRVTTPQTVSPGEYALVLSIGGASYKFFDFGVD